MTGHLLKNLDHPFVRTLRSTEMGRGTLAVEQAYGGGLLITNGTGSSYESRTNTISIGLGAGFGLGERAAQKRLIHEQTHRFRFLTGKTANPLAYELEEYVHLMLQEEADASR